MCLAIGIVREVVLGYFPRAVRFDQRIYIERPFASALEFPTRAVFGLDLGGIQAYLDESCTLALVGSFGNFGAADDRAGTLVMPTVLGILGSGCRVFFGGVVYGYLVDGVHGCLIKKLPGLTGI